MTTVTTDVKIQKERTSGRIPIYLVVTMLYWFSIYIYVPFMSPYVKEMGASNKLTGIIVGSYGFVQMLLRIPLGILSDKLQKRKVFIILGVMTGAFSSLGFLVAKNPIWVLVFRSMAGCAASFWVIYTVLFSSYFEGTGVTKPIGIISFFMSTGQMTAMLLGGYLFEYLNANYAFLIGGIAGMLGLVLSFFTVEKKFVKSAVKISDLIKTGKEKSVLIPSSFAIVVQFITFATSLGFTTVYAKSIGATGGQLGILALLSSLSSAVASLNAGTFLVGKLGERTTIAMGLVIMALSTFSIPLISNIYLLYLAQALSGMGRGFAFTVLMALSIQSVSSDKRGTAMGFFQSIYSIGMFLGPVVFGFVSDIAGVAAGFYMTGSIGLIFAAVVILVKTNKQTTNN